MGKVNKLLVKIDGIPLVRKIAIEMVNSNIDKCQVVLGYQADKVAKVLKDLPVQFRPKRALSHRNSPPASSISPRH